MNITFRIKGKVLDREGHPVEGLSVKVYDDKGVFTVVLRRPKMESSSWNVVRRQRLLS